MIRKIFKKIYIYFFINSFFIRRNNNNNFSYNFLNINFDNYESSFKNNIKVKNFAEFRTFVLKNNF